MKERLREPETALEIGVGVFGLALVIALGAIVFGKFSQSARYKRGRDEGPPPPSSVPNERHRNVSSAAAR